MKFHETHTDDPDHEKQHIIKTAAKLILADIKAVDTSNENYPETTQFESEAATLNYLPESLQTLLKGIIKQKNSGLKVASTGQSIMQSARPRVLLAPLQIALAIQMHHHFSSKFLIDCLHKRMAFVHHINKLLALNKMLLATKEQISRIMSHSLFNTLLIMWIIT